MEIVTGEVRAVPNLNTVFGGAEFRLHVFLFSELAVGGSASCSDHVTSV